MDINLKAVEKWLEHEAQFHQTTYSAEIKTCQHIINMISHNQDWEALFAKTVKAFHNRPELGSLIMLVRVFGNCEMLWPVSSQRWNEGRQLIADLTNKYCLMEMGMDKGSD